MSHNLGVQLQGRRLDRGVLVVRDPVELLEVIGGPGGQGGAEGVRRRDGDQSVVGPFHLREHGMEPPERPADRVGHGVARHAETLDARGERIPIVEPTRGRHTSHRDTPGDRSRPPPAYCKSGRRESWRSRPGCCPGAASRWSSGSRPASATQDRRAADANRDLPCYDRSGGPARRRRRGRSVPRAVVPASPRRPAAARASRGPGFRTLSAPRESLENRWSASPGPRRSA